MLAHPERLAEDYRRRLQPETRAKHTPLATVESQISTLRQGVARLIDSYADGLIDKDEFEPRITGLRQRLARLEGQRQALADEVALHGEWQLIIGRLEDCAAKLHDGLEAADWASQRDLIRAMVKRVEVARDDVNIVFRIDPYPGDADPEKKSWQLCRGRARPPLRRSRRWVAHVAIRLSHSCLQPVPDQPQQRFLITPPRQHLQQLLMINGVEAALDVRFHDEAIRPKLEGPREVSDRIQGPDRSSVAITARQEVLLIDRLQYLCHSRLKALVLNGWNP